MTKQGFLNNLAKIKASVENLQSAMYEDSTPLMDFDDAMTLDNDFNAVIKELNHTAQWIECIMK